MSYVSIPKRMDLLDRIPPLRILVANTKVPKNTKALVAGVRVLRDALPAVIDPILVAIDGISQQFICAASGSELEFVTTIATLVKLNQHLLCALGVGHASLDALVLQCSKYEGTFNAL